MLNKIKICFMITMCLCLAGCRSGIVNYTDSDAAAYNLTFTKASNAEMVSMKKVNDDKVWTFKEKNDRGLSWQIFDHHYSSSVSLQEANELISNYNTRVLQYYLAYYEDLAPVEVTYQMLDGFVHLAVFNAEVTTRAELNDVYTKIQDFLSFAENENSLYAEKSLPWVIGIDVVYHDESFYLYGSNLTLEQLEIKLLQHALIHDEPDMLEQFTDEEAKSASDNLETIAAVIDGEEITVGYAEGKKRTVSAKDLFALLSGYSETEDMIQGEPERYTIEKDGRILSLNEHDMVTFFEVETMTGIKLYFASDSPDVKQSSQLTEITDNSEESGG